MAGPAGSGFLSPPFLPTPEPTGELGSLALGDVLTEIQGVCVAFDSATFDPSPVWHRLDNPTGPYTVTGYTITRGRRYETDRTDTGRATITMIDKTGALDPTNTLGAFYGKIIPRKQAAIALQNPITGTWRTIYRGFVSAWRFQPHPTERWNEVTIELDDALAVLAATEIVPDGSFGHQVQSGNVVYNQDANLAAAQTRIVKVLDEVGWPGAGPSDTLRDIFTGNVGLQQTTYSPRSAALNVLDDACDAEFPAGVSCRYVSKDGRITFRGRYTRFKFLDASYGIDMWEAGDDAEAAADPTNVVPLVPPLLFYVDDSQMFTSAISTPQNVDDSAISAQYVTDTAAADAHGVRTWSAENLVTLGGEGPTTALAETKLFAEYVVGNYSTPRLRVETLCVIPRMPGHPSAAIAWNFACNVELNDVLDIHMSPAWSTGSTAGVGYDGNFRFFVEGITYEVEPLNATMPLVKLMIDVSPSGYFSSNPFADA